MVAKRPFGSWHRMTSMVKHNFPEQWEAANAETPAPAPQPTTVAAATVKKEVEEVEK